MVFIYATTTRGDKLKNGKLNTYDENSSIFMNLKIESKYITYSLMMTTVVGKYWIVYPLTMEFRGWRSEAEIFLLVLYAAFSRTC